MLLLLLAGCTPRPRPPALQQDKEFYHNPREGLRFRPPAGWSQQARANLSKEDKQHESRLVKYKRISGEKVAFLEVSVAALPESTDVTAYLERSLIKDFKRSGKTETLQVGQLPATREAFTGFWDREKIIKEVVAVRRGEYVYFFTGSFSASDPQTRPLIRQAVESVVWENDPK